MSLLIFRIEYRTRWGENLYLNYTASTGAEEMIRLYTHDGQVWEASLSLPTTVRWIDYAYRVINADSGTIVSEDSPCRRVFIRRRKCLLLSDTWTTDGIASEFLSKVFTQCLNTPLPPQRTKARQQGRCLLLLRTMPAPDGYRWAVLGNCKALGNWNVAQAAKMVQYDQYEYALPLSAALFDGNVSYKYVLQSELNPEVVVWEEGADRRLPKLTAEADTTILHNDSSPRLQLPLWKGAGVVIPVFSLRSEQSQGIGDFADLKQLVAWASRCSMRAIQILPINDTNATGTWRDSYPYNPISVFALHPAYLSIRPWSHTKAFAAVAHRIEPLNRLAAVDYEQALALKLDFLHLLYKECGESIMQQKSFLEFCADNKGWLIDYTRFCFLRDSFSTADFRLWPSPSKYLSQHHKAATSAEKFWSFVQYLLHQQLMDVRHEATQHRVLLKGDIPIGVSPCSADAWVNPHLYHFDGQAGAPPDYFSRAGQNWGFPTYNWETMAADNYAWWRQRLTVLSRYFDAYRLDHVLGFFRIWEIPATQVWGTLGRFRPALPLSDAELRGFGFTLPPMQYARPHFTERQLNALAEQHNLPVLKNYFQKEGGYYTLRPEVATQRAVLKHVAEENVRAVLLELVANVLFIPDAEKKGCFHPAISGRDTLAYASLPADQRAAFDAIHYDFFYNRHNDFWKEAAMRKLEAVVHYARADWMLPCAEDLGFVPACVNPVLNRLHILTLEIQSMPKVQGSRFAMPQYYPYRSVATIATHDMAPFRHWWNIDVEGRNILWRERLGGTGEAPAEATPQVCTAVVGQHLQAGSMLCLLSMQDWLAMDKNLRREDASAEQINDPSNPQHNWNYRLHLNLETLLKATDFNERIRVMIEQSGR